METLLEILQDLHPEVDFETEEHLIDNKILNSFDIVTIVAEIDSEFDVAIPAPCLGFSRQEYWSGLPFPPPMHESEK